MNFSTSQTSVLLAAIIVAAGTLAEFPPICNLLNCLLNRDASAMTSCGVFSYADFISSRVFF